MSVLTRHPSIPTQRAPEREALVPGPAATPPAGRRRRSRLLIAGGAAVLAAGVGTTAYVVLDDGSSATTPSTRIDLPYDSEANRDAAWSARDDGGATAATEAKRDAAWSSRDASSTG